MSPSSKKKRNKFVLSLGSGGLRGFVHLGVYKALYENNIKIDAIYGTSVGSLVGAFIAAGWKPDQFIDLALSISPLEFLDISFPHNGYIQGKKLNLFIEKHIKVSNIEDLGIPLTIVATGARTGEAKYFQRGKLSDRIQASSSIPNVFKPVIIDGVEYLDGDLCSPVPIKQAREDHKDAVILAVNIISQAHHASRESIKWASLISRTIYRQTLVANEKSYADFFINPILDSFLGLGMEFTGKTSKKRIDVGYHDTMAIMPQLKQILAID